MIWKDPGSNPGGLTKKNKKNQFTLHKMESFPLYICKQ